MKAKQMARKQEGNKKKRRNSRENEKKIEWNVSNIIYIPLTAVTSKNNIKPTNSFVKVELRWESGKINENSPYNFPF